MGIDAHYVQVVNPASVPFSVSAQHLRHAKKTHVRLNPLQTYSRSTAASASHIQKAPQFGNVSDLFMKPISLIMSAIEANSSAKLAVTDLGAMVIPRTTSEYIKRGPEMGFETIFREINTTLNIYMIGWLGALGLMGMSLSALNPKAMSMRAWISADRLKAFGDIANSVFDDAVRKPMTATQVQKLFLDRALQQVDSTDAIAKMPKYKHIFPYQGQITPEAKSHLIKAYLGQLPSKLNQAINVEEKVQQQLIKQGSVKQFNDELGRLMGEIKSIQLDQPENTGTYETLQTNISKIRQRFFKLRNKTRLSITRQIRGAENPLIDYLHKYAIEKGGLSSEVFMLDKLGRPIREIGGVSTKQYLKQLKFFMEEFLNRSMAQSSNGQLPAKNLSRGAIDLFKKRLGIGAKTDLLTGFLPRSTDSLMHYLYKTHRLISGSAVILVTAIAISVVYINNGLTRSRHGGLRYFPGEGLPPENDSNMTKSFKALSALRQGQLGGER